jgi:hypothetical protein
MFINALHCISLYTAYFLFFKGDNIHDIVGSTIIGIRSGYFSLNAVVSDKRFSNECSSLYDRGIISYHRYIGDNYLISYRNTVYLRSIQNPKSNKDQNAINYYPHNVSRVVIMVKKNTFFRKFGGIQLKSLSETGGGGFEQIQEIPNPLVQTKYSNSSMNAGSKKVADDQYTGFLAERITDDPYELKGYGIQFDMMTVNEDYGQDISKNVYQLQPQKNTYIDHQRDTFKAYPEYKRRDDIDGVKRQPGLVVLHEGTDIDMNPVSKHTNENNELIRLERERMYVKPILETKQIQVNEIRKSENNRNDDQQIMHGVSEEELVVSSDTRIKGNFRISHWGQFNNDSKFTVDTTSTFHDNMQKTVQISQENINNLQNVPNIQDIRDMFFPVGSITHYFGRIFHNIEFTSEGYVQVIPNTGWVHCNGAFIYRKPPFVELYDYLKRTTNITKPGYPAIALPNIDMSSSPVGSQRNSTINMVMFSGKFHLSAIYDHFGISGELVFDYGKYLFLGQDCVIHPNTQELIVVGTTSYGDSDGTIAIALITPDGDKDRIILRHVDPDTSEDDDTNNGYFGVHVELDPVQDIVFVSGSTLKLNQTSTNREIIDETYFLYAFKMSDIRADNQSGASISPLFSTNGEYGNLLSYKLNRDIFNGQEEYHYIDETFPNSKFILSNLELKMAYPYLYLCHKANKLNSGDPTEIITQSLEIYRMEIKSTPSETPSETSFTSRSQLISASPLKHRSLDSSNNANAYMIPYDMDVYVERPTMVQEAFSDATDIDTQKSYIKNVYIVGKKEVSNPLNSSTSYNACVREFTPDLSYIESSFNQVAIESDISNAVATAVVTDASYVYVGGVINYTDKNGSFFVTKYDRITGTKSIDFAKRQEQSSYVPETSNNHIILDMCANLYDLVTCMTVDNFNNVLIVGRISDENNRGSMVVHKIQNDGFYDASFGDNGILWVPPSDIQFTVVDDDGNPISDYTDNKNVIPTRVFVDQNNLIYITGHINDFQTFILKLDQYGNRYTRDAVLTQVDHIEQTEKKYFQYESQSNVHQLQKILSDASFNFGNKITDFSNNITNMQNQLETLQNQINTMITEISINKSNINEYHPQSTPTSI